MVKMAENGIETRRFFYPIHLMPPYKKYVSRYDFNIADELSARGINLPSSIKLTEENIKEIANIVMEIQSTKIK
jgi:perosamine synthetase